MTDNKKHDDESVQTTSQSHVSQTAATTPAMPAQVFPTRPRTVTNLEIYDLLHSSAREQKIALGDVNRALRDLGNQVDDLASDQKKDRARIGKIETALAAHTAALVRAPAKSLHSLEECDIDSGPVMSADERFSRLERDGIRKRKSQSNQTITLVGALAAAVVTIIGALSQLVGTRAEHGAREGAAEAVYAVPPRMLPVAIPVVAPSGTP